MIDCHVHTHHSGDAHSSLFEMCEKAVAIGLSEIGFADHLDFTPTDSCYQTFHYQAFMDDVARARDVFGDKLIIRAGLEVDYQVRYHEQIVQWLEGKSFDYVIGSAHYVDGILLEEHEKYFPGKDMPQAYNAFFDVAEALVETGLFDIAAHLDLCKRYGTIYYGDFAFETFRARIAGLLEAIIRKGMALEVNTSGLRQSPNETYPSIETIRLYRELGGEMISIGSDAHRESDLSFGIPETVDALAEEGLEHLTSFEGRRPIRRSLR